MTAHEPIGAACREVSEVDALMRALRNLRHWSATAAARRDHQGDWDKRLYVTAAQLREEARADSLLAAYGLFEIDAIHDAWLCAEGRRA